MVIFADEVVETCWSSDLALQQIGTQTDQAARFDTLAHAPCGSHAECCCALWTWPPHPKATQQCQHRFWLVQVGDLLAVSGGHAADCHGHSVSRLVLAAWHIPSWWPCRGLLTHLHHGLVRILSRLDVGPVLPLVVAAGSLYAWSMSGLLLVWVVIHGGEVPSPGTVVHAPHHAAAAMQSVFWAHTRALWTPSRALLPHPTGQGYASFCGASFNE